jgi:hypothetical protein|tara:strand:+ start:1623 stop:1874 length:252 start_codon:yes stop_codon:yes gene_type:complete
MLPFGDTSFNRGQQYKTRIPLVYSPLLTRFDQDGDGDFDTDDIKILLNKKKAKCEAIAKSGNRCRLPTLKDSVYCNTHKGKKQ